jgi:hypothetical protein
MRICRVALIRRRVKRLVANAEKRSAQAEEPRGSDRFRPLTEAEAEVLVGGELLAALGDARSRAKVN